MHSFRLVTTLYFSSLFLSRRLLPHFFSTSFYMALLLSSSCRFPCSPLVICLSRCLSKITKYKPWKNTMVEFGEKQRRLLFSWASSHASYNPLLKIPWNKYKTHKHWKKSNVEICRETNVKRVRVGKWEKLIGFQRAGLSDELSLLGRDNSAWCKNQFPTLLKPFVEILCHLLHYVL